MSSLRLLSLLLCLICLLPATANAQTDEPSPTTGEGPPPIPQLHTVQEGENLTFIAQTYGVAVADLQAVNGLTDESILQVGQQLIIPGGQGEATTAVYTVQIGDSLAGIATDFNTTVAAVAAANRLIYERQSLAAGQTLAVVSRTGSATPQPVTGTPHVVASGETLLMIAVRYNVSPAAVATANDLPLPAYLYPGQRLRLPGATRYRDLPGEWVDVRVRPLPLQPGQTLSIYVENLLDGLPFGQFAGQNLHFITHGNGYVALVGLDAFTPAGLYPLRLEGSGSRPWRSFAQDLQVEGLDYGIQYVTVPEALSGLLDPQLRRDEDAFLETIYTRFTDEQRWQGVFQTPVTNAAVTAGYGAGRSYNGGPVDIFHTGVDFAGAVGTPILAPADGVVVFNDFLELRGLAVIIDHGLGVMTAYFHLSDSFVSVGDEVSAGQAVAAGGSTGLSSGPHLHWDLRIMNVPVNGLQWTTETFP